MFLPVPSQIGYAALGGIILAESAGVPVPGETALITAGGLVAAGHLSLPLVILVATLAAITGDTIGSWLGRRGGRALLLRDGFGATHRRHAVRRADRYFARYGAATVFLGAGSRACGSSPPYWPVPHGCPGRGSRWPTFPVHGVSPLGKLDATPRAER